MEKHWTEANIPDLNGKVAVVTGSNSGIGWNTARALASKRAHVVMAVRSTEKGKAAADAILREFPNAKITVSALDLTDLGSIRSFADAYLAAHSRLSLLINNAGVMGVPFAKTKDGFEMQFGTNHLGHFALTGLLLPALLGDGAARVVTVSSGAHMNAHLDFDHLQSEDGYRRWRAYGRSKLANLLFAFELERRFEARGQSAISVASHPGWAATNLASKSFGSRQEGLGKLVQGMFNVGAQSAQMGALPTLFAATDPSVRGGEYFGPTGMGGMRGYPGPARSSRAANDREDAKRLWRVSEELTGVHYA